MRISNLVLRAALRSGETITQNTRESIRNFAVSFLRSKWSQVPGLKPSTRALLQSLVGRGIKFGAVLPSYSLLVFVHAKDAKRTEMDRQQVIKEADTLFSQDKFEDLVQLLKSQPSWYDDPEMLWRVARVEYQMSKYNEKEKKQLLEDAWSHVSKSLELNPQSGPAHKWAAILLDAVSQMKGTKERVANILKVREHMEQSIKYSPTDPTAHYLLGEWHYGCYQVSWIERKIANALFGKLPEADMDVALKMFEMAETLEPNFYSKNKTLMAKTLMALKKDQDRVKTICSEVIQKYNESSKWDDQEAVKEAKDILYKMGVKVQ